MEYLITDADTKEVLHSGIVVLMWTYPFQTLWTWLLGGLSHSLQRCERHLIINDKRNWK